jgi:protein-S-isoprenylcysteine O-methyltransferase Ste14
MSVRESLQDAIRPSTTKSTAALWAKSLLNAVLFFCLFMVALPALAHWLYPRPLPLAEGLRRGVAGVLAVVGLAAWIACLDTFSRRGRGTPLPVDAPRELVTTGLFALVRNPIMVGELMVIWGAALYLGSWGAVLYAAAITAGGHFSVCLVEEPELRKRFGATYDDYCRRVPRWLPRLRRRRVGEETP